MMFITSEIVGEYVQCHLGGHLGQTLHQKVGRPHPHLQCAEGMFDRLATLAHRLRVLVETLLHRLQYLLCFHRVIRRSLPVVQRRLMAQLYNIGPITVQD